MNSGYQFSGQQFHFISSYSVFYIQRRAACSVDILKANFRDNPAISWSDKGLIYGHDCEKQLESKFSRLPVLSSGLDHQVASKESA